MVILKILISFVVFLCHFGIFQNNFFGVDSYIKKRTEHIRELFLVSTRLNEKHFFLLVRALASLLLLLSSVVFLEIGFNLMLVDRIIDVLMLDNGFFAFFIVIIGTLLMLLNDELSKRFIKPGGKLVIMRLAMFVFGECLLLVGFLQNFVIF